MRILGFVVSNVSVVDQVLAVSWFNLGDSDGDGKDLNLMFILLLTLHQNTYSKLS